MNHVRRRPTVPLSMTASPTTLCSAATYAQFCLDVPRIKLVVDGCRDGTLPPPCVYAWLVNLFPDERTGLWFAYWCTQTALADLYIAKLRRIHAVVRHPAHYHLLDDGQQTVEVRTQSDTARVDVAGTLRLFKPFRLCRLDDEGTPHAVRRYHLHVTLFADGQPRRTTAHVGAFVVDWEPVMAIVRPRAFVRVCHRFGIDEHTAGQSAKNSDEYDDEWLIVKKGVNVSEMATCTT